LIYFCIPTLNEERTVGVVLWKLRQVMTELQRDFQIIVVDDASTDATQEVLNPYLRVLPLTLIRNQKQLGYAASLEIAIREAVRRSPYPKRDALITLQADFTEDPDCVPALVKKIEAGADLVTATTTLDEATPTNVRRARRLFRWLVGRKEWAELGDPFSGLRAYRVMTMKRAIDGRGTSRLVTWDGWAANAELVAQTMPHSRRNDTIETTLHYKRLQRPSRFRFFGMLQQVMGVRTGKTGGALPVQLPESTIVVPGALAVELAVGHQRRQESRPRHEHRRPIRSNGRGPGRGEQPRPQKTEAKTREEAPKQQTPRAPRPPRPPKQPRAAAPQAEATPELPLTEETIAGAPAPAREKKRRRPRRRGKKPAQNQDAPQSGEVIGAETSADAIVSPETVGEDGAPVRKKSRRGRRGGRGRRRTPRTEGGEQINNDGDSSSGGAVEGSPTEL
jgi:hypothetical protein